MAFKYFRKHQKKIYYFLTVIIVITFGGLWGVSSRLMAPGNQVVGEVFGRKIKKVEFYNILRRKRVFLRDRNISHQELIKRVWNEIIMYEASQRAGIRVSDKEVRDFIKNASIFQHNKKFYYPYYQRFLQQYRISPSDFEKSIRESIAISKFFNLMRDFVHVTKKEVFQEYHRQHDQINFEYIEIFSKEFEKGIVPSKEELLKYYQTHMEAYRVPIRVKLSYVFIPFSKFEKNLNITEEQMKEYYKKHKENFIIRKVDTSKGKIKEKKDFKKKKYLPFSKVKKKIEKILVQEKKRELAKHEIEKIDDYIYNHPEKSLKDICKDLKIKYRITDYLTPDKLYTLEFGVSSELVFNLFDFKNGLKLKMQKKDISVPVETTKGYLIFSLEDYKESYIPAFENVKEKVKKDFIIDKAKDLAFDRANEIRKKMLEASFGSICQLERLVVKKERYTEIPKFPPLEEIKKYEKDYISRVIRQPVDNGREKFIIIHILGKRIADENKLDSKMYKKLKYNILNRKIYTFMNKLQSYILKESDYKIYMKL